MCHILHRLAIVWYPCTLYYYSKELSKHCLIHVGYIQYDTVVRVVAS